MAFCRIPSEEVCFVQNLVDLAIGMVGCFVQNVVGESNGRTDRLEAIMAGFYRKAAPKTFAAIGWQSLIRTSRFVHNLHG